MTDDTELPLDHYRNRISLAGAMGMTDYANDMAALLHRLEVAERWNMVQAASRKALNDGWNRLRSESAMPDTGDHIQRDSMLMEAGARYIIVQANGAAELAARAP
jgi:hypothetical protein